MISKRYVDGDAVEVEVPLLAALSRCAGCHHSVRPDFVAEEGT